MADPEQRHIDWDSAEVENATLILVLTGASSKAWKQRFEGVLALLGTPHSAWGEVHLDKNSVRVAEVQGGTETELRHFLESVLQEVNSELPQPEKAEQGTEERKDDEQARADRQMTAAFRAFAQD
jgi:hypothetical protein